jgi:hypothetical protein
MCKGSSFLYSDFNRWGLCLFADQPVDKHDNADPMTVPEICPTGRIISAGSEDSGAILLMLKKKPAARTIKRIPKVQMA